MSSSTRRGFMALSAAGVATGVVAAVAPSATAATAAETTEEPTTGATSGSLVAYVHDAARGEVSVMHGEHEVLVHDPALVRLISKHA